MNCASKDWLQKPHKRRHTLRAKELETGSINVKKRKEKKNRVGRVCILGQIRELKDPEEGDGDAKN